MYAVVEKRVDRGDECVATVYCMTEHALSNKSVHVGRVMQGQATVLILPNLLPVSSSKSAKQEIYESNQYGL